jgi:hypothetical protein
MSSIVRTPARWKIPTTLATPTTHAAVDAPNAFEPKIAARQCVPGGKSRSAFVRDRVYAIALALTTAVDVNVASAAVKMDACERGAASRQL